MEGAPFDPRSGTIPNQLGRVLGSEGAPVPGLYTCGWYDLLLCTVQLYCTLYCTLMVSTN